MRYAPLFALAVVGCGPDLESACNNYLDAYSACASQAYGDTYDAATMDLPSSTCDAYSGMHGKVAKQDADLLQCYADAYNGGDCSSTDGFNGIAADMGTCG